ncbi:glycosyltransferase family 2 protein [Pontibacillus salipaludis]|uniref:glycosyltransferase family 2 protein n=1 Tax=Pontibacillus salipaludis TaxID=1697394 RepID=UPI0031E7B41B
MGYLPLISVIIPCYNSEKWIRSTLKSVVDQTFSNLEIIVVDDGSKDNTRLEIERSKYEVKYYYQQNKGPAAARNLGIEKSTGEYVAFLDSDDLWENNKIEEQLKIILEKDYQIDLVLSNVSLINEKGDYLYTNYNNVPEGKKELVRDLFLGKIAMNTPTIFVKKKVLEEIGGFNEGLPLREDHFLLMEIANKYNIYHIKTPLVKRRITDTSMSVSVNVDRVLELNTPFVKKSLSKFPFLDSYESTVLSKLYAAIGKGYWLNKDNKKGIIYMLNSIRINPLIIRNYFFLMVILLKVKHSSIDKLKDTLKRKNIL